MSTDTPILAYGRRIIEADQRAQDHDLGGPFRDTMSADQANRINGTANDEIFALHDIVCDLPAETLADTLIQLDAAAAIMEVMMTSANAIEHDKELQADCGRVMRVLASVMRVVAKVPGAEIEGLTPSDLTNWTALKWKGDLPPVRIGEADAALIADCDEFARRLKAANASNVDMPAGEMKLWDALSDRITTAPTHTTDGVIARIRALTAAHGDFGANFDEEESEPAKMLIAIMRAVDPAAVTVSSTQESRPLNGGVAAATL